MFQSRVAAYISHNALLSDKSCRVLVTLSGGADSVALLRVLLSLGYECVAAHCNFHLRGAESDRDEQFVRSLCMSLNVRLLVKDMNVHAYQCEKKVSVEMACRELRYQWFREICNSCGCKAIAVAHHVDDNIETFFLNALRGSGITGLAAMRPRNGNIIRPLLCVSRKDIEEYLESMGQGYVTDSTNFETDFKRNKIRNIFIPILDKEFQDGRKCLEATINHTRDYVELYNDLVEDLKSHLISKDGVKIYIDIEGLKCVKTSRLALLIFDIVKEYGFKFTQCENISNLILDSNVQGQLFHSSTHTLSMTGQHIVIEATVICNDVEYDVNFNSLESLPVALKIFCGDEAPFVPSMVNGKNIAAFDSRLLNSATVKLRRWRAGDRMRPFGMKTTKLLSDMFTDLKLSPEDKKKIWILEADGEIVWVLGMRTSELYRVVKNTTNYVILSFYE